MITCDSCHRLFNSQLERIGREGLGLNKPDFYCYRCPGEKRLSFCTYECKLDHIADKHTAVSLA